MSSFIVDLYDAATGAYIGPGWNSSHLGGVPPKVGDTILAPLSKRDFGLPRDADKYWASDIVRLYFLPTLDGAPCLIKALVNQREVSEMERSLL
jgi:hypothetical protein